VEDEDEKVWHIPRIFSEHTIFIVIYNQIIDMRVIRVILCASVVLGLVAIKSSGVEAAPHPEFVNELIEPSATCSTDTANSVNNAGGEGCGCSGTSGGLTRDLYGSSRSDDSVINENETGSQSQSSGVHTQSTASSSSSSFNYDTFIQDQILSQMTYIPNGTFLMGTHTPILHTDGEGPQRHITLTKPYLLDTFEVSNAKFHAFVEQTHFVSESEVFGWSFVFESAVEERIKAKITEAVMGAEWWLPVNGSYWREPEGPGSDVMNPDRYRGQSTVVAPSASVSTHRIR
jgi:formylglycine-generating enzyme required for sulfatase activity